MKVFLSPTGLPHLRMVTAVLGMLGAMLMLVGDLLLYGNFSETPTIQPWVAELLSARGSLLLADSVALNVSTILGPIAALFYLGGSVHLFLIFSCRKYIAFFVGIASASAFMGSGAYHAQFGILGHVARYANSVSQEPAKLLTSVETTLITLNAFVQITWLLAFGVLFVGIISGWTVLQRKMAWISPLLPIAMLVPLVEFQAHGWSFPWSSIAAGGIYNFLMALCFLVFLLASRGKQQVKVAFAIGGV